MYWRVFRIQIKSDILWDSQKPTRFLSEVLSEWRLQHVCIFRCWFIYGSPWSEMIVTVTQPHLSRLLLWYTCLPCWFIIGCFRLSTINVLPISFSLKPLSGWTAALKGPQGPARLLFTDKSFGVSHWCFVLLGLTLFDEALCVWPNTCTLQTNWCL